MGCSDSAVKFLPRALREIEPLHHCHVVLNFVGECESTGAKVFGDVFCNVYRGLIHVFVSVPSLMFHVEVSGPAVLTNLIEAYRQFRTQP